MAKKTKEDKQLLDRLEKMFGFGKNKNSIFPSKEEAQQIVDLTNTPKKQRGRPKKNIEDEKITLVEKQYNPKSLFDLNDVSDVDAEVNIQMYQGKPMNFSDKIFNLFTIAKEHGMNQLNADQVTGAYYRVYCENDANSELKTKMQICNKMYYMALYQTTSPRGEKLVKIGKHLTTYELTEARGEE